MGNWEGEIKRTVGVISGGLSGFVDFDVGFRLGIWLGEFLFLQGGRGLGFVEPDIKEC